ncbi:MAG: hypothetical protein IBX55_11570 [Methyloprofundus sp.]|nr:hypothetical protein [Methyloprofundus sp.]
MVSLKHFQKLMFVLVFAFNSAVVNAMTPEQMAKGAFNNLKGQTGQSVLGNMGISGSGQGNIGSGKGGLNISQTATGSISCPFSEDVYGFGTVNGVSFACQQSVSGRSLYYCTNTLSGAICGDDDFKPMQTVKTDGEATMMLQSCASDGCSIKVDIKRKQTFDGNNLESHGQSALSQNYANENSIASLTLGSGVYDEQGNVIHAGKNSNMGKYQETLLSKDQQIDCAQRQFNEIESDGETGTCARPDVPVNVFEMDSSQDAQCQDVSQCLDMVISQITEQKTCTLSIPSDTIEQNDLTPYINCNKRVTYTKYCDLKTTVSISSKLEYISGRDVHLWNNYQTTGSCSAWSCFVPVAEMNKTISTGYEVISVENKGTVFYLDDIKCSGCDKYHHSLKTGTIPEDGYYVLHTRGKRNIGRAAYIGYLHKGEKISFYPGFYYTGSNTHNTYHVQHPYFASYSVNRTLNAYSNRFCWDDCSYNYYHVTKEYGRTLGMGYQKTEWRNTRFELIKLNIAKRVPNPVVTTSEVCN